VNYVKKPTIGIFLSFVSLTFLGVMPIISNGRPMEVDALSFALFLSVWQLVIATPCFVFEINKVDKGIFESNITSSLKKRAILIILVTGSLFGLSTFLYVLCMKNAGTVNASIAIQAYPLFSIIIEYILLKKTKNKQELLFTTLLLLGLYYLGTNGTLSVTDVSFWTLMALAIPFIWSVAHIIIKEVLEKTPITPVQVTFFRVLVSTLFIGLILIFNGSLADSLSLIKYSNFQFYAAMMGGVYYAELVVWFYAIKHVDVSVASSITTPWPLVTLFLAVLLLEESVTSVQLISMVIVFFSVYGIIASGRKSLNSKTVGKEN